MRVLLVLARVAPLMQSHWNRLSPHERRRLAELVRESRGLPWRLSPSERDTVRRLMGKLDLPRLARDVAKLGLPTPWRPRTGR
jgi:hypothetical protein